MDVKEAPPLLIAGLAAALLIGGGLVVLVASPDSRPVERPLFAEVGPTQHRPVALSATLSTNRARVGDVLAVEIRVTSTAPDEAVEIAEIRVTAPGLDRTGCCWDERFPVEPQGPRRPVAPLEPGRSVVYSGELRASRDTGRFEVGILALVRGEGRDLPPIGLNLGPVVVEGSGVGAVARWAAPVYQAIEDLGLPIGLALLGAFLAQWGKKREDLRRGRLAATADYQAQIRETWGQLLKRNLEDSKQYYMLLKARVALVRRDIQGNKETRMIAYALLLFIKATDHIRKAIGGFHFQCHRGERVAQYAHGIFNLEASRRLGRGIYSRAMERIDLHEGYGTFERRFASGRPDSWLFREFEAGVERWRSDADSPLESWLPLLRILYEVLGFEANRPLAYWYRKSSSEQREEIDAMRKEMQAASDALPASEEQGGRLETLRETLRSYLENDLRISHVPIIGDGPAGGQSGR